MNRILPALIAVVLGALSPCAMAGAKRMSIEEAQKVVAALFPDYCGESGRSCSFSIEPRATCPFELFVATPAQVRETWGIGAIWVGLDERKRPIAFASHKKYGDRLCASFQRAS
ncbi:hypothetical protein BWI17_00690 [Betaproteobacteria bacterium GR16-43]|nr:hypothetical protein BWI17_00690 [Betaproteobacteria bacterium GR16-43]